MREILFRGKQKEGRWAKGVYFKHDTINVGFSSDDPKPRHLIIQDGFCDWGFEPPIHCVDVDPDTVGQYTGLTDKKAKKIFEGDIVSHYINWLGKRVKGCVEYDSKIASWVCRIINDEKSEPAFLADWVDGNGIEVIGNIHDNPELLKGGIE